jgi:1-deoxy-D-xylulose-5-phosphate synthase
LIEKDDKIVAITAGMKDGTGLSIVEKEHPKNFFDVGIAEEYAVTFASGLCAGGLKPVVALYSTFAQRSYDQILHDVCLQNLPVVFCLDRAGVVGKDGKTHQGVFDLSFLSHIPNLEIFAPNTTAELSEMLVLALKRNNPVVIRYPKNYDLSFNLPGICDGLWQTINDSKETKVSILAVGPRMLQLALRVSEKVSGVRVITARSVKPLDETVLENIKNTLVITLEENSVLGGFGSSVLGYYSSKGMDTKVVNFGIKDQFLSHGSIDDQLNANGISVKKIIDKIEKSL